MGSDEDDRVPGPVKHLLSWDVALTKKCVDTAFAKYPSLSTQVYRSYMKVLEISCHGIPWFGISLISIYLTRCCREVQVNLLLGLLYDVIVIALLKAVTRRHRPPSNKDDMFFAHGPDKFSFPSGHATRAVFLAFFFTHLTWFGSLLPVAVFLYAWAALVSISRVLLRRHHVLDVACGVGIGVFEFLVLYSVLWVGADGSKTVGDWIAGAEDEFDGS